MKRSNVEQAEASLAESEVYLRTRPRLAAGVKETAQKALVDINDFRTACDSLLSKEKTSLPKCQPPGCRSGPYYQPSIEKANAAEKKVKI